MVDIVMLGLDNYTWKSGELSGPAEISFVGETYFHMSNRHG